MRHDRSSLILGATNGTNHFGEDAADGPDVDAGGVELGAEQDFGRFVPQGDDLVGVGAQRDAEGARQSKVGQLQQAVAVHQQVLRLHVAVQHAVRVAVPDALVGAAPEQLVISN